MHFGTPSEQRQVAPIHPFLCLPQSHVRCFSLAEDAAVGKCSPQSSVLPGKDLHCSVWEQGTGGWHILSAVTGLASLEQNLDSLHPVCALNSWKNKKKKRPGWAQHPGLASDQQNSSHLQHGRAVFPWEHRSCREIQLQITWRWGDVEVLYARNHLTSLKVAANLGTGRRQIAILVTK